MDSIMETLSIWVSSAWELNEGGGDTCLAGLSPPTTQLKIWKGIFQYLVSLTWILWENPRNIFEAFILGNAQIWTADLRRWSREDMGRTTRKILWYLKIINKQFYKKWDDLWRSTSGFAMNKLTKEIIFDLLKNSSFPRSYPSSLISIGDYFQKTAGEYLINLDTLYRMLIAEHNCISAI